MRFEAFRLGMRLLVLVLKRLQAPALIEMAKQKIDKVSEGAFEGPHGGRSVNLWLICDMC
jgi:hypothetical protein